MGRPDRAASRSRPNPEIAGSPRADGSWVDRPGVDGERGWSSTPIGKGGEAMTFRDAGATAAQPGGVLIGIRGVASMLGRSPRSIERDDGAGRLPRPIKRGGSKPWR